MFRTTFGLENDKMIFCQLKKNNMPHYQVNLPHFRSPMFLRKALERYINFLFLKYKNPDTFLVPCYAIDIMWHTHQLHPVEYSFDCEVMFEKIFPHDDTVNDRSHGSKLVTSPTGIWHI